jgi:hypothetical protein
MMFGQTILYYRKVTTQERTMLAFQGYFQSGRFVTATPVQIPERKKTIVTVLDESVNEYSERKAACDADFSRQVPRAYQMLWDEIIDEIKNSDEVLEGDPERLHFRSTEETEIL